MTRQLTREELLQSNEVRQMVAERAYFISEQQGFAPGREQEHWFAAEAETVEALLGQAAPVTADGVTANGVTEKKTRTRKAAPKAEGTPRKTTRKKTS